MVAESGGSGEAGGSLVMAGAPEGSISSAPPGQAAPTYAEGGNAPPMPNGTTLSGISAADR